MAAQEGGEDISSSDQEVEEMEEYSSTSYNSDGEFYQEGSSGYTCEPEYAKE